MNKKNNVFKAGVGYTLGNYLIRGLGFITIPIFSRLLSTSDFGIYNTFLAYEAIAYILIGLALNGSVKNAKYKFDDKIDQYVSSVMIIPIIILVGSIVFLFIAQDWLVKILSIDSFSLLMLLLYSYSSSVLVLYQTRISLDYDYVEYLKISLFNAIFSVVLSVILIFIFFDTNRYYGRIIGATVTYIILAIYVVIRLFSKARPTINKEYWKYGLKISVPLIPHGLAQILLLSFDRIMINSIVGSVEAGIYSFAYTIYSLVQITATSLDTVYSTWVFQKYHDKGEQKEIQRTGTGFMLLIGGICSVTILIAPELIRILGGNKYSEAIYCAVPVIFAGFFAMAYCIPAVMEYYYEKTKYISIGTTIAAIINIILNYIFIPQYGYIAAAYTTMFSYIVYFTLHMCISRKLSGFSIIKLKYLCSVLLILGVSFWVGLYFVKNLYVRYITAVILVVIGIILLYSLYGKDMRNIIKKFLEKGRKK